jgi:hypothetical protein
MTERESFEINELKNRLIKESHYKCQACGRHIIFCQLAHRIKKSKYNIKKYGKEIIHHPLNLKVVCSLRCNSKVDIGCNEELEKKIFEEIKEELKK